MCLTSRDMTLILILLWQTCLVYISRTYQSLRQEVKKGLDKPIHPSGGTHISQGLQDEWGVGMKFLQFIQMGMNG